MGVLPKIGPLDRRNVVGDNAADVAVEAATGDGDDAEQNNVVAAASW